MGCGCPRLDRAGRVLSPQKASAAVPAGDVPPAGADGRLVTFAAACAACPLGRERVPGWVACTVRGARVDRCPVGVWDAARGRLSSRPAAGSVAVVRRYGVRWVGLPMPDRLRLRVRAREAGVSVVGLPGCGCVLVLKAAWVDMAHGRVRRGLRRLAVNARRGVRDLGRHLRRTLTTGADPFAALGGL